MYGLSERSYKELLDIVASIPQIEEAVIYGSRARGDFWPSSDIDLSLKGHGLSRRNLRELNDKLYESHIPYFFDTNIYSEIRDQHFKNNIDSDGRVIYQNRGIK